MAVVKEFVQDGHFENDEFVNDDPNADWVDEKNQLCFGNIRKSKNLATEE